MPETAGAFHARQPNRGLADPRLAFETERSHAGVDTVEQRLDSRQLGRAAELTAVEALLDGIDAGMAALGLEGEAGIGKTTVWLAGVERARSLGHEVLLCRPAETETGLPFVPSAISSSRSSAKCFPRFTAAAARARDGARTRRARRELRPACRLESGSRRRQARCEQAPVLLAIDDVQWLDASSAGVLDFVVRRLLSLPVRLLIARRSERDLPPPLQLAPGTSSAAWICSALHSLKRTAPPAM